MVCHLTLTLLLHYLVKYRSRIFVVYNSECILAAHASAQHIIVRPQNHWKSAVTRLTTSSGVCFASKSIIPRSRMLTNWNDASTTTGPLGVTWSLNVLSASTRLRSFWDGHFSTRVIKMMSCDHVWLFPQTVTASRICRYSPNHLKAHSIIALTAQPDTSNFPR